VGPIAVFMRSSFPFLVLRGALLLLLVLALPVGAQRAFGRDVPAPVSARDGGLLRLLIVPTVSTHELRLYGPCVEDGRWYAEPVGHAADGLRTDGLALPLAR
jgi:hypothetical protein